MEITKENYRQVDAKLFEIARSNDMSALQTLFPDAENLVEVSNWYQYGYARNSFLAQICNYSSPEFVESVFKTYFPGNSSENQKLKTEFLKGRDVNLRKINYKYFAPNLPAEITGEVNFAYRVDNRNAYTENNYQDRQRLTKIYSIIKQQHNSSLPEDANNSFPASAMTLHPQTDAPAQEYIIGSVFGSQASMYVESYPPLFLRKLKDEISPELKVALTGLKPSEDILLQTYNRLDFPEDYVWAVKSLKNFEEEYKISSEDEEQNAQVKFFAQKGGAFSFEDKGDPTININTLNKLYTAFASEKNGKPVIGFNCSYYESSRPKDGILAHELTHQADLREGCRFSDSILFKVAYLLVSIDEDPNHKRLLIRNNIEQNYGDKEYFIEGIANVMQNAQDKYEKDHLLRNVYQVMGRFADAKVHDKPAVINRIRNFAPSKRGSLYKILDAYEDFIPAQTEYYSSKRTPLDMSRLEKNKKLFNDELSEACCEVALRDIELMLIKDLHALRKDINAINRDPEASKLNLPWIDYDIKSARPIECEIVEGMKYFQDMDEGKTSPDYSLKIMGDNINKALATQLKNAQKNSCYYEEGESREFNSNLIQNAVYLDEFCKKYHFKSDFLKNLRRMNFSLRHGAAEQTLKSLSREVDIIKNCHQYNCSRSYVELADSMQTSPSKLKNLENLVSVFLKGKKGLNEKKAFVSSIQHDETASNLDLFKYISAAKTLFLEEIPAAAVSTVSFSPEASSLSRVSQECEIVISNLSLLKTEDKEDGLIPNVWNYTLGSSFTDVPYEAHKCYVGKLKEHQEEIDYEINYGNEQDKLRSFIAIREEYKNNQSCKELPADLRFDSLGMESFTTNKIGAVIRKYYNQLTEPSANSPKKEGNLRG